MVKLAHDIGVSDVADAKACRKAGIPLPGLGHWAKSGSGKQRQPKPKPPQAEGKVRFQVLDRDTPLATTGTDLNSPIVRRTITDSCKRSHYARPSPAPSLRHAHPRASQSAP